MFQKQRFMRVLGLVLVLGLLASPLSVSAASSMTVVAGGLDNPRGLAFGPGGALFIAEAGKGGSGPCVDGPEGGLVCYGASGAVTRLKNGVQTRIVTGLPSLAAPDGSAATGAHDVSFQPDTDVFHVQVGLGANPARRSELGPAGMEFGRLLRFSPQGKLQKKVDVSAYEASANPDGGEVDSNPYGVLAVSGKRIVADAGANALLQVNANESISTLAVFPDRLVDAPPFLGLPPGVQIPMQAVPTSVALGPDGAYYVGQLTGFPFPVGGASVYRVVPGQAPAVFAGGFTNIIDLAFGPDGSLYVLEITSAGLLSGSLDGALIRVAPNGARTTVASSGLVAPGGLAIGPDGAIYVTNFSIMAGAGQVLKIVP